MVRSLPAEVQEACDDVQNKLSLSKEDLERPRLLGPHALLHIVVMYSSSWDPKRYLNLLLLYGGKGGAAARMRQAGVHADSLDKMNDPSEDILSIRGCVLTIYMIISVL